MVKFNINNEWSFIISETHKEKPDKQNYLRRELLFILQTLLPNTTDNFQKLIYIKTKNKYLFLRR
jgi:hypothetical protein